MTSELRYIPDWEQHYSAKPTTRGRVDEIARRHRRLIACVLENSAAAREIIEIGIGTGLLCSSVARAARDRRPVQRFVGVDQSPLFLAAAKPIVDADVQLLEADSFRLPFDGHNRRSRVIFHQGLLEHFSDENLHRLLIEQLRVAGVVCASVPSCWYCFADGMRGDERMLTAEQWISILQDHFDVNSFYYGENEHERYHICLTVRLRHDQP